MDEFDDPDCDGCVVESVHPFQNHFENINLLPNSTPDEDGLGNMFSLLSDENVNESNFDDFEPTSKS